MTEPEETRDHVLPGSDGDLDTPDIEGYDFSGGFDFQDMLDAYKTTGFQATHLHEAIELIREMREEDATIYLTYTSNIVSSGLREIVAYLARENLVDIMITTSGSITEDVIKS
ncbi:MAG: deoxyhypusine synthase family protein, partial [Candidatus Nanohaloarchaea archaeon]|nr:deoxyhypusine synthase family protein [Candidatus Nanohaloarchaea archaeon]